MSAPAAAATVATHASAMMSLLKPLADCAVAGGAGGDPTASVPKPLSFETPHPYTNDARWQQRVEVKGAAALLVSFDPQSRSENGCDYLMFYKVMLSVQLFQLTHMCGQTCYNSRHSVSNSGSAASLRFKFMMSQSCSS